MKVSLFITCLADNFFPRMGIAVVKVLEHFGCRVDFPCAQTCCGQPLYNNGFQRQARELARRMVRIFADSEYVVTPSGSCAAMVQEHYSGPLNNDAAARRLAANTYEFTEFLGKVLKVDLRQAEVRWRGNVTYHYSCHLRGLGVTDEAVRLMRQIDGIEYVPSEKADQCCGFGGMFATKYPQISGALVRDKVTCIAASGAETVVSNEPGCTMNISGACRRQRCPVAFISLAEIIAEGLGLMEPVTDAPSESLICPATRHV
ncbi:MAG TPA: (Fe-S)-binding protein [Phycisphaerae bacterium]